LLYAFIPPAEAPLPEATAVRPVTFKSLVGKGHPEFSTGRQQDVAEYLLHLLDQVGVGDYIYDTYVILMQHMEV
jgi:uncharacterized UBP type Zn finger protein